MAIVIDKSGNSPNDPLVGLPYSQFFNYTGPAGASPAQRWPGGRGTWEVVASGYGGATSVRLQMLLPDGVTWQDVDTTNASFTANGLAGFEVAPGYLRTNVAGGTGVSAMTSTATPVRRTIGG